MDYRNYYIKNYFKRTNKSEFIPKNSHYTSYEVLKNTQEYNPSYQPNEIQPQIIYLTPPSLTPQSKEEKNYDYDAIPFNLVPNTEKKVSEKRYKEKKHYGFKWFFIYSLILIIATLSSFVFSDYISNGKVFESVSTIVKNINMHNYYAVVLREYDDFEDAKIYAKQLRLQGGGGYIIKAGAVYKIIGEIFIDQDEAQTVADKQRDSEIMELSYTQMNLKGMEKEVKQLCEQNSLYNRKLFNFFSDMSQKLISLQCDEAKIKQYILDEKAILEKEYLILQKSKFVSNSVVFEILTNMNIAIGLLNNLSDENIVRPNLLCDLRYYKVQAILNDKALCEKINEIN